MKKTIFAVLFVAMFVASSMLVLPAHSTESVPTDAFLDIVPNPAGLGETVLITGVVAPAPPEYEYFVLELSCSDQITHELLWAFECLSDEYGGLYYEFTATSPAGYIIKLDFAGQWFEDCTIYYEPCTAQMTLTFVSDIVPEGEDVTVFPDPEVSLVFDLVTAIGALEVDKSVTGPPPDVGSLIGPYYCYINTTAQFEGNIIVRINYDDAGLTPEQEEALCMIQTEIVPGDVNRDGIVNGRDISTIARALPSYPGHRRWNPSCDLNKDDKVNTIDLLIAVKNRGMKSQWEVLTSIVDPVNNIITGITDHLDELDPFGVR